MYSTVGPSEIITEKVDYKKYKKLKAELKNVKSEVLLCDNAQRLTSLNVRILEINEELRLIHAQFRRRRKSTKLLKKPKFIPIEDQISQRREEIHKLSGLNRVFTRPVQGGLPSLGKRR
jgi:hypothetical protein